MMKKLMLVLGIIMLSASSVYAHSMPRWSAFPLTVYIADTKEADIVKSAFESWQNNSKYIVRFIYKKSNVAKRTSKINVDFSEKQTGDKPYNIDEKYSFAAYLGQGEPSGYFYHVNINIALKDKDGNEYTKRQLKAISLQAVGRALGVPCQSGTRGVMVCDDEYNVYGVTKEDYEALFKVYKKTKKEKQN